MRTNHQLIKQLSPKNLLKTLKVHAHLPQNQNQMMMMMMMMKRIVDILHGKDPNTSMSESKRKDHRLRDYERLSVSTPQPIQFI